MPTNTGQVGSLITYGRGMVCSVLFSGPGFLAVFAVFSATDISHSNLLYTFDSEVDYILIFLTTLECYSDIKDYSPLSDLDRIDITTIRHSVLFDLGVKS